MPHHAAGGRNKLNDPNGDGKYERILSYGARSFSIWRCGMAPSSRQRYACTLGPLSHAARLRSAILHLIAPCGLPRRARMYA